MKLSDLSMETMEKIKKRRWDRFIEKHEGPEPWEMTIHYTDPEFMNINGYDVLLPVDKSQHSNIETIRCIESKDGKTLTIFLKDTTYYSGIFSGFVAVCEKVPSEEFFISVLYHEWMIIEDAEQQ